MNLFKNKDVRNAIFLGTTCSVSYLGVYFARNVLGAVSPQMIETGAFTNEYIGSVSSLYFIFYAVGQLINGVIGDKIKAKYMISLGLILAGVCNFLFPYMIGYENAAKVVYGLTGFFLAMIYAPMTKVVSENTTPIHAVRCSLGYTFSSFFGSPLAGIVAAALAWKTVFDISSIALWIMGVCCFILFIIFEKAKIITYGKYKPKKDEGGSIKILIKHQIIKFTLVSIITGIIRTTVVFWLPTYIAQYLGFSPETSALLFTVSTLIISASAFIAIFMYERLGRNMNKSILISFIASAISFAGAYFVKMPAVNIAFMVLAILFSNCAASILWSVYCPSLRDTGMVSSATGFLDFVSYMAAAASSTLFANSVSTIGWQNLILSWFAIIVVGIIVAIPFKKKKA
ncbi:MAG: MFS transporter [Clostridia bacterium]|nr:MFS transporter [Clostridia bacterium]